MCGYEPVMSYDNYLRSFFFATIFVAFAAASQNDSTNLATFTEPTSPFIGYLISTFSDVNPTVQFYLSKGDDPSNFVFANQAKSVLVSKAGTKAVRDVFLTCNGDRSQWYMMGTGKL